MRLALRNGRPGTLARIARHMSAGGAALAVCAPLWAGPEGERVVSGTASFDRQGAVTTITAGHNAMIQYNAFNIAANEAVRFVQPDSQSRVFNQIVGNDPSIIAGRLDANGIVYIMNPSGVYFRQGALVNVGQIYAGAGHISPADFLDGIDRFQGTGAVVNEGVINASKAVLIGQTVVNTGTINTPNGLTVLASGSDILIGEYGGRIFAKVSGANSANPGTGVEQRGTVNAAGGRAVLASGDLYAGAIWHRGTTKAAEVSITGGPNSAARIEGTIDASNAAGAGGSVQVTAGSVRVQDATINASGSTAGGQIEIGGGYQGRGELANAHQTVVDRSTLSADSATRAGGQIVVWSDGLTGVARSNLSATGSTAGGLIETSGKQHLDIRGVDVRTAGAATGGLWLLDPSDVDIISGGADSIPGGGGTYNPTADSSSIDVSTLATALANGNSVTITTNRASGTSTTGNITLSSALNVGFGANNGRTPTLTLRAANNITLNAGIAATANAGVNGSNLSLVLSANDPAGSETAAASGTGSIALNSTITTLGGSVSVQVGANTTGGVQMNSGATINTAAAVDTILGGAVNIISSTQTAGSIQISGPITTQGGSVQIGNNNQTSIIQVQSGGSIDASRASLAGGTITINSQQVQASGPLTTRSALVTLGRSTATLVQLQSGSSVTTNGGGFTIAAAAGANAQVAGAVSTSGGNVQISGGTIQTSATINSGSGSIAIGTDGNATNITLGASVTSTNNTIDILTAGSGVINLNNAISTSGAVTIGSNANAGALTLSNTGSIGSSGSRVGTLSLQGGAVTINGLVFGSSTVGITASTSLTQGGASGVTGEVDTNGGAVTYTLLTSSAFTLNATGRVRSAGGNVAIGQLTASTGAFNFNAGSSIDTTGGSAGTGSITVRGGPITVSSSLTTNGAAVVLAPNGTAPLTINGTASILTSTGSLQLGNGTATAGATTINSGATLGTSGNRLGSTEIYGTNITINSGAPIFVNNSTVTIGNIAATGVTLNGGITTNGGSVSIMPAGSAPVSLGAAITTSGGNVTIGHAAFASSISSVSGGTIDAGSGQLQLLADNTSTNTVFTIRDNLTAGSLIATAYQFSLSRSGGLTIQTTNNQSYTFGGAAPNQGGMLLTLAATLNSTNGSISVTAADQGVVRGARALTVSASNGSITLNTSLGSATATLGSFSLSAPTITLAGSTNTTSGANANGSQVFTGNLVLSGTGQSLNATASVTDAVSVTGNVTSSVDAASSLTVNTAARAVFGGAVGLPGNRLASFATDAGGTTRLGGNVNVAGTVSIGDALELTGDSIVASSGAGALGNVTFQSTVNSSDSTARSLTVNTAGTTAFQAAIGQTNALSSLATDSAGSSSLGGAITTSGASGVNFADNAALTADTTINAGTGTITFGGTVNGAFALAANASGATTFSGAVGGSTPLVSISTDSAGTASFASITTQGAPGFMSLLGSTVTLNGTYQGGTFTAGPVVRLAGATTLNLNAADATFQGTVNSTAGNNFALTVNTTGATNFQGAIGRSDRLASLTTNAGGSVNFSDDVRTTGNQQYNDAATVNATGGGTLFFDSSGVGSTITFNSTLSSIGAGTSLEVSANSGMTFVGDVNLRSLRASGPSATLSLGNVTVDAAASGFILLDNTGTTTLNGTYNAGEAFSASGPTIILAGDTTVNLTAPLVFRSATIGSTINSDSTLTPRALTINSATLVRLLGQVGGTAPLSGLTANGASATVTAVGARVAGNILLNGGNVSLGGTFNTNPGGSDNGTFTAGTSSAAISLVADTTVSAGSGAINFNGTVNGAFALTANSTGVTTFAGNVGTLTNGFDGTALTTLTTNAGGSTALPAFVRTSSGITFGDIVTLSAASHTVNAGSGNLAFGPDIRASSTNGLTAQSSGTITLNTVGGNSQPLNFLATQFSTLTVLNGNIDLVQNAVLGGNIRLDSNVVFTSTSGRWNGPAGQSINANTAGGQSLTINGLLSTELGSVGATTALSSLTINSALTNFTGASGAGVTVRTTGNQSYNAVTLTGPTAATNFNHTFTASGGAATITFAGALGAAAEHDTQAVVIGGGTPSFSTLNSPFRLRLLSFASTLNLTSDPNFNFGSTPVQFAAISGPGGGTNFTITGTGTKTFSGALTNILNFSSLGSGMTCIDPVGGTFAIGGSFNFAGPVCIGGPNNTAGSTVTLDYSATTNGATFGSSIESNSGGARGLTLNSGTGLTSVAGAIGTVANPLASLTSNAAGSFTASAGANTTGAFALNDTGATSLGGTFNVTGMTVAGQVTLASAVTLNTGNSTINWSNAGDVTGGFALTINNTGTATFAGRLLSLASITSDEGGTLNLSGANTTLGNLTLRDTTINLSGNFGAGNNSIIISRISDSTLTTLNISGTVQLATTNANPITINANVANTGANADLDLRPGTNIPVPAGSASSVGAGSVTISGNVTGLRSLQILTGNTASVRSITVTGAAGGPVTGISLQSATTTLNGTYITNNAPFAVTSSTLLAGHTSVQVGTSTATFTGTVNSTAGNAFDLAVDSTNAAGITFGAGVGSNQALRDLTTTGAGGRTALGDVTVTRAIALGHNVVLNNSAVIQSTGTGTGAPADITISGTVNADLAANLRQLTLAGTGNITVTGAVGGGQSLASLSSTTPGTASFASITTQNFMDFNGGGTPGSLVLNGLYQNTVGTGDIVIGAAVRLAGNTTLTNAATGAITFLSGATVNATTAGGQSLTVNTNGATTFGADLGATTALASLTTDNGGTVTNDLGFTRFNNNVNLTTTGNITFNDRVIIGTAGSGGSSSTFTTNPGSTVFFNANNTTSTGVGGNNGVALQASAHGINTLDINGGATQFGAGRIGGSNAADFTNQNFAFSTLSLNGGLTVPANFTLDVGSSDLVLGPVTGTGGSRNLTVNSSGTTRFTGALASINNLTTDAPGVTQIETDLTTAGTQQFSDEVLLPGLGVTRTLTAANFVFGATVQGTSRDGVDLVVNTTGGGSTQFQGLVGGLAGSSTNARLNSLTTNTDGTISSVGVNANSSINLNKTGGPPATTLSGSYSAFSFSVSGPAALSGTTTVTTTGGNLSFNSTIDGGGFALTLNDSSATTTISGAATNLLTFDTDATGTQGGTLVLNGVSTTNGGINLRDTTITLGGTYTIAANGSLQVFRQSSQNGGSFGVITSVLIPDGTTTINLPNGGTLASFFATINGVGNAGNLVVNGGTGSVVTFGASIGASTRLQSIQVGANGTTTITNALTNATAGTTIRTTGNQTFNNQVTFNDLPSAAAPGPDYTLDANGVGAAIAFNASPSTGASAAGRVGLIIANGTPSFAGSVSSPNAFRQITFSGTLNLSADTTYDLGSTAVTLGAVNGVGGNRSLTINTSGLTRLTGAFTNIQNYTSGGGGDTCIETSLSIAGDFTLGSLGTPENLCLGGTVPGTITLTYAGLDVFGQTYSAASPAGARNLTLNGSGATRFRGLLGRSAANTGVATLTSDNAGTFRADAGGNIAAANLNDGTVNLAGTFNTGTFAAPNAIVLTGDTTINASGSTLNLGHTGSINGDTFGPWALTAAAPAGTAQFGPIGQTAANTRLFSVDLSGVAVFLLGNVTTTGNQIYAATANNRFGSGDGSTITLNTTGASSSINLNGPTNLFADTVTFQSVNGAINFSDIVERDANQTSTNLVVNSAGAFTASSNIGGFRPITSLTTDAGGSISLRSVTLQTGAGTGLLLQDATVTLSGTYTTNGRNLAVGDAGVDANVSNALLAGNTTVTTGAGTAFFEGTVNSSGAPRGFTVTAAGLTTFRRSLGNTTALATLQIDGGGSTTFGFDSATPVVINTAAAGPGVEISFADAVTLADNLTINASGASSADVSFASTINADASANNRELSVTAGGIITVTGNIGATQALSRLFLDAGTLALANATLNGNNAAGAFLGGLNGITLNGSTYLTNGTDLVISGPVTLTANTTLDTTGSGSAGVVDFDNDSGRDHTVDGTFALTINAKSDVFITGDIGTTNSLTSLGITSGGTIYLGEFASTTIRSTGNQTYDTASGISVFGDVLLFSSGTVFFNTANIDGAGSPPPDNTLAVSGANVQFQNATTNLGATTTLQLLDLSAANLILPFDSTFNANAGDITLGTVAGSGGFRNLTINTTGLTRLTGTFSGINNLTTNAGGETLIESDLVIAGTFTFNDDVALGGTAGSVVLNASNNDQSILFNGRLYSDAGGARGVELYAGNGTGQVFFGSTVGTRTTDGDRPLASVFIGSGGTSVFAGQDFFFTSPTIADRIRIQNPVTLQGTTAFRYTGTASIGSGAVQFDSTIRSAVDGNGSLFVYTPGAVSFNDDIGGGGFRLNQLGVAGIGIGEAALLASLQNLTTTGGVEIVTSNNITLNGSSYTVSGTGTSPGLFLTTTSGSIDLANPAITINVSGAGAQTSLGSAINGSSALTITGTGNVSLGTTGADTALISLDVTSSAGNVNLLGTAVTTTGTQTYSATAGGVFLGNTSPITLSTTNSTIDFGANPVLLQANAIVDVGNGNITFGGPINGSFSLDTTSNGTTTFRDVGQTTALDSLTTNGTGLALLNGNITTFNAIAFNQSVQLNTANITVASTDSGDITFARAVSSTSNRGLQINTDGVTTLGTSDSDAIGGLGNTLAYLRTDATGINVINVGAITTADAGDVTILGSAELTNNLTINAGTGDIRFGNSVTGDGTDLTLNATGLTRLDGNVSSIATLTTNAGGTTQIGAAQVSVISAVFNDAVTITATPGTTITSTGNATTGTVTFNSTIDGPGSLTVTAPGDTTFTANIGATTALAGLTTNGGGSTIFTTGSTVRATNLTFNDAVLLPNNASTGFTGTSTGTATFNNTLNSAAAGTGNTLSITSFTLVTFNGEIGNTNPLLGLAAYTHTVLNANRTAGAAGLVNANSFFFGGNTTLQRDTVINSPTDGGFLFSGFGSNLDSDATPRSLTINAPASAVVFNSDDGSIGDTSPLRALSVTAGVIGFGDGAPVSLNLTGGPAIDPVLGSLTAPPIALYLNGPVILGSNLSINAGNGRVLFTGPINAQNAGIQSLSIVTRATSAAPVEFARPLSGSTSGSTDADRLAQFRNYRAGIVFGGSIGATTALNNLFISFDGTPGNANDGRSSVPGFSTILFANVFNADGAVTTGPAGPTNANLNSTFTATANRISFGYNEKVLALGNLSLTADRLDLGDTTALGSITATSPTINIRTRSASLGLPYFNSTTLIFGFAANNLPTEGNDEGTSLVSGSSISFSSAPAAVNQNFAASTNPDPQFATPDGQNITVAGGYRTRSYFAGAGDQSTFIQEFLDRDLGTAPLDPAANTVGVIQLSRRAQGPTNVNVSETVTPIIIVEIPLLNPPSTLGQALADQLREIDLKLRLTSSPEELIDVLIGRSLYNDRPLSSDPTEFQTSVGRLSLDQVTLLLDRVSGLRARRDEFRTGLDEAYNFFLEGRDFDPAGFRDMLLGLEAASPARQAFALLVEIFNRIDQLGLGPNETRQVKLAVVGIVQGDTPPESLYAAVVAAQQPATPVGEPQAALP